jgi:hypothetical protein
MKYEFDKKIIWTKAQVALKFLFCKLPHAETLKFCFNISVRFELPEYPPQTVWNELFMECSLRENMVGFSDPLSEIAVS